MNGRPVVPVRGVTGHHVVWSSASRPGPGCAVFASADRPEGRERSGDGEESAFARALGWSVAGHFVLVALLAPLMASSALPTALARERIETEVTYDLVLVDHAAHAEENATSPENAWARERDAGRTTNADEASAFPGRGVDPAVPVPAISVSLAPPSAEPEREVVHVERIADPARSAPSLVGAPTREPSAQAPVVAIIAKPSLESRTDQRAEERREPAMARSSATGSPRVDGAGGDAGPVGVPRAGNRAGDMEASVDHSGAPPSASQQAGSVATAGPAAVSASSENLLAAYRARIVAWLQPRVQRRFAADPDGRALDAASLAVVRMQVLIDGAGRATVGELSSPSPALERIVRDVLSTGELPRPPSGLVAPVTLRLRIRFSLV